MKIRSATYDDLPALLMIHNDAVRNSAAIWLVQEDTLEERKAWLEGRWAKGYPVYVAESDDGTFLGYASFGPYKEKSGYDLTVEHSVYVMAEAQGSGAGSALLNALIEKAKVDGYHVMIAGIDSENTGSIRFHERFGFHTSGVVREVGFKYNRWLDLVIMSLILDETAKPPVHNYVQP
ncbi:GNAT family N-acetyltransferase [Pseudovibrio exalbescens]|uniref:GNAT family N-acetyltransferase n=1 Tax=Pseudovibrio exalbescens TaxID=197461 RepID=UPI0023656DA7|nr:GNAT family N-acetyltransferase [Pseudovibrio exalbescens]MDD7910023.1 GNAT family N-acetyltransferase [Pseudovibrio exalbescens]